MKIICIGRNYVAHIKELGNEMPTEPVFFIKPDTALLIRNRPFYYPDFSSNIHYELEIVLKICKTGKCIQPEFASSYFDKIGLGLDLTARDLQDRAKEAGLPWFRAKGFDFSAPVSEFLPKERFSDLRNLHFRLEKNGKTVQDGNTGLMIYPFEEIIAQVSKFVTLRTGDLIFTGTPAGVGPISRGDLLEGFLEEEKLLKCAVR